METRNGATFTNLLDEDHGDESIATSRQHSDAKRNAAHLTEVESMTSARIPKETQKRPLRSIEGKTYEQIEKDYAQEGEMGQASSRRDDYSFDESRERLLGFVDVGLCVDMVMGRHCESLDPQAQSETLKQLANDAGASAS